MLVSFSNLKFERSGTSVMQSRKKTKLMQSVGLLQETAVWVGRQNALLVRVVIAYGSFRRMKF